MKTSKFEITKIPEILQVKAAMGLKRGHGSPELTQTSFIHEFGI